MNDFKGSAFGILAVVVVLLWLSGMIYILAGILAGTLIVLALMMTIEQLPGFWTFATWGPGKLVVLFGTAWLTHAALGADSVIGMIALCWSLIFKVLVIEAKKRELYGA